MISEGEVALTPLPHVDGRIKNRPVLVLRRMPRFGDLLVYSNSILFADGDVWAVSADMPIDALKPFLTITAAKTADRDKQLGPYRVD